MNEHEVKKRLTDILEMSLGKKYYVKEVKFYSPNSLEIRIEDYTKLVKILRVKNNCIVKRNLDFVLEDTDSNCYEITDAIASCLKSDVYLVDKSVDCEQIQDDAEIGIIHSLLDTECVSFVYMEDDGILKIVHNNNGVEVDKLEEELKNTKLDDLKVEFKYKLISMRDFTIESSIVGGLYRSCIDANDIKVMDDYFEKSINF